MFAFKRADFGSDRNTPKFARLNAYAKLNIVFVRAVKIEDDWDSYDLNLLTLGTQIFSTRETLKCFLW